MQELTFQQFHTIAILGGTFNPVHVGHVEMAKHVLRKYPDIEQLFLMPNHLPAYKEDDELVSKQDRLAMLSLAVSGMERVSVSSFEIVQDGYTYTANTLRQIREQNKDLTIYFIIGDDSLFSFHKWYQYEEVMKLCNILVIAREEGAEKVKQCISEYNARYPYAEFAYVEMPHVPVSSSDIRRCCQNGEDITGKVPEPVRAYIEKHQLYKKAKGSVDL